MRRRDGEVDGFSVGGVFVFIINKLKGNTMPRFSTVIGVLLIAALLMAPMLDASAAIKVKTTARSWNQLPGTTTSKGPWNIQNGLRAVGVGSRTYFVADTVGSGAVGTPTWTIATKPAGSTVTTLDSASGKWINSFRPDVVGQYIVSATVGGQSGSDTIWASTYAGVGTDASAGCFCHAAPFPSTPSTAAAIKATWLQSAHAGIFKEGISGYLETERGKGAYAASCIKCHVIGWDTTAGAATNGNFGRSVKASGWDTTWYKGLEVYNGDVWTVTGDTTAWKSLNSTQQTLGTIGCESCHGPAADHKTGGDKMKIGRTLDPGVCNQCHDGSGKHSIGTYFRTSAHGIGDLATPAEGGRSNCQPCHTGRGFLYYMDHNQDTTGLAAVWNANTSPTPIVCVACHDPHGNSNPAMIRTMKLKGDTLRNGYKVPAESVLKSGNLCGNCHNARYDVRVRVNPSKPPYYGFTSRYGPHYSGQTDMLLGSGGYEFGDTTLAGVGTHHGLEGGCVTCHMQERPKHAPTTVTKNNLNHTFTFDTLNAAANGYKPTDICSECHGEIEDFNDIRAGYDYDRNGKIEGVQTEVAGMLAKLKAVLPKDSTGEVIGSGTLTHADSVAVNGKLNVVAGIYNYWFVKNDRSMGVHNTKYAVGLIYKSLGWTPLSVKQLAGLPQEFAMDQNYPNPFNPSTTIRFSVPHESKVSLVVYDMTGAVVKTILNENLSAGNKEVTWDGTNSNGAKVATGMYIYRLEAGNFSTTRKMLMLK
jgi:hypothetical protein